MVAGSKGVTMQYKKTKKIIIDKIKLDILFRLGCPDEKIITLLKTGIFEPTGDDLIDNNLESLIDYKEFENRGGNHNPSGKNQHSGQKVGQKVGQNLGQKVGQNDRSKTGQTTDIDKDKDKDIDKDKNICVKDKVIYPTIDEWLDFCKTLSLNPKRMESQFYAYESNGWKDSRGKTIKNWKMKIRQVWDKPDNKTPDYDIPTGPIMV